MVELLESHGMSKDRVILVNPLPYFHEEFTTKEPYFPPGVTRSRSNEAAAKYANACIETGTEIGITTLDAHKVFKQDKRGKGLLKDGLHLNPVGAQLLFEAVWSVVEKKILEFNSSPSDPPPTHLEEQLPQWDDFGTVMVIGNSKINGKVN